MIEDMATLIEEYKEFIVLKFEHFMLSGKLKEFSKNPDEEEKILEYISKFVEWVCDDCDKDLNVSRGKDGLSYLQRRELNK